MNDFYNYLRRILNLYKESVPVLKEKFDAIYRDDLDALNKSIQFQQAFLLKTRGFDAGLTDHLASLNITGPTLTDVILQFPEEDQDRFDSLLEEFEFVLRQVRFYNEKCQSLLQTKLYIIDKQLSKKEFRSESTVYSQEAKELHKFQSSRSFEANI